jgi:catalase
VFGLVRRDEHGVSFLTTATLTLPWFYILPFIAGGALAAGGKFIAADFQLAGGSSVLFDTVYLALSEDGADAISNEAAAVAWVHDAFAHLKVIGATAESQVLLEKAGVLADDGIVTDASPEAFLDRAAAGRVWKREPQIRTVY